MGDLLTTIRSVPLPQRGWDDPETMLPAVAHVDDETIAQFGVDAQWRGKLAGVAECLAWISRRVAWDSENEDDMRALHAHVDGQLQALVRLDIEIGNHLKGGDV